MATWERLMDAGALRGRASLLRLGQELRDARRNRGLSVDAVARAVGISNAEVSRIERGLSPKVPFSTLALMAAAVGLEISARCYPGGPPIRDRIQLAVLTQFRGVIHRSLEWLAESRLDRVGDLRAWDAVVRGRGTASRGWAYGVEVETLPQDVQATTRRISLKVRDSGVDGALLVMPPTRRVRELLRAAMPVLAESFPVPGDRARELLAAGADPGGSAIILVRVSRTPTIPGAPPGQAPRRRRTLVTPRV
jgi:transcriptional regulator with XRE-family HTH domain